MEPSNVIEFVPNADTSARHGERRCGVDRRGHTRNEFYFAAVCALAGVRYRGVQPGFSSPTKTIEALVMFDDTHETELGYTTLYLPVSEFTFEAVKQRIAEKEAEWAGPVGPDGAA